MPIFTLFWKSIPFADSRKPCTKCWRDCSPSVTMSRPASSCALSQSNVASRLAAASSSPDSFLLNLSPIVAECYRRKEGTQTGPGTGGEFVDVLLRVSRWIDALNAAFGKIADWAVLISCLISAGNAMMRYGFSLSSNAWLEIQWYLFGVMVMFGAAYTLRRNEHVRIDVIYGNVSARAQIW